MEIESVNSNSYPVQPQTPVSEQIPVEEEPVAAEAPVPQSTVDIIA